MAPSRGCASSMQGKIISRPGCVKRVEKAPTFILGSPCLASRDSSSRTSLFLYTTWGRREEDFHFTASSKTQQNKTKEQIHCSSFSRSAAFWLVVIVLLLFVVLLCLDEPSSEVTIERKWQRLREGEAD